MARKHIKIGGVDSDGTKYELKLEGSDMTSAKVLGILTAMGVVDIESEVSTKASHEVNMASTGAKIQHVVDKFFPTKFTSSDVLEKYEDEFNEPIKLSVISTYLSRFSLKGKMDRTRTGREWTYNTIKIAQRYK